MTTTAPPPPLLSAQGLHVTFPGRHGAPAARTFVERRPRAHAADFFEVRSHFDRGRSIGGDGSGVGRLPGGARGDKSNDGYEQKQADVSPTWPLRLQTL